MGWGFEGGVGNVDRELRGWVGAFCFEGSCGFLSRFLLAMCTMFARPVITA